MKIKIAIVLLFINFITYSQTTLGIFGKDNWLLNWTNFKSKTTEYNDTNVTIFKNITENTTFFANKTYLLTGTIRVINNAVLTIEPGTVIKGNSETIGALIITKGAKIIAKGIESNPIVFTSNKGINDRKAGDWGGLVLLGNAPINTFGSTSFFGYDMNQTFNDYGGKKPDDSSGILEYVRVEFCGIKDESGYASNGIAFAGVGSKTILNHIMVSDSADDSFQIYGGNLNLYNIVSLRAGDDDFDFTEGTNCLLSNSLAIRNPNISDPLRSRCLEIESFSSLDNFDANANKTKITLENVSLVDNGINEYGLLKEAIFLDKEASLNVNNCVATGFESFIAFNEFYFQKENYKKINLKNLIIDSCPSVISDTKFKFDFDLNILLTQINEWFDVPANNIVKSKIGYSNLFIENSLKKQPDFRLK